MRLIINMIAFFSYGGMITGAVSLWAAINGCIIESLLVLWLASLFVIAAWADWRNK